MKRDITEFKDYNELIEFFDNPVIQYEIDLREDSVRKTEWNNMLFTILNEHIRLNKIEKLCITWDKINGFHNTISYEFTYPK